ncbi:MAG TPA: GDP-mannose 4,6-dehydratase, partial [Acetobacteraceae bacterium]|nr:GDP-mannose 4,6-dehydratase [Acetobacteraceae bacterium]
YGDGSQARDFVFVEDLCDGIVRAIMSEVVGVIQLGSGRPVTVAALIGEIRRAVAPRPIEVRHEPPRAGEVHTTFCDIAKARRELQFDPATPLAEGLARTWHWFLSRNG